MSAASAESEKSAIGFCWIDEEGTIFLNLYATGAGASGISLLSYSKDHERYYEILSHVGPLEPGEEKPVLPWT